MRTLLVTVGIATVTSGLDIYSIQYSHKRDFRQSRRLMSKIVTVKASQKLYDEVVTSGLCTLCGGCVWLCPYFRVNPRRGTLEQIDVCDIDEGRCYTFCPRTCLDLDALNQATFGKPYTTIDIGEVRNIVMARSLDKEIEAKAQYGGVVSTLIIYALNKKLIDTAVLTKSVDLIPQAIIATSQEEVLLSSGSNYMACSTLEAFNKAASGPAEKIGIVGVPCQIQALAKRRIAGFEDRNNIGKLALTIGLFCTWALDRSFWEFIAKKVSPTKVKKTDIPPPPAGEFQIYTDQDCISIPLEQVREFIRPACLSCVDMTAEYADISVGSVEGIEGWNTVIIRSKLGSELMDSAQETGLLEVKDLPVENLNHLKEASLIKKRRAIDNILKESGSTQDLGYLKIKPEVLDRLLLKE